MPDRRSLGLPLVVLTVVCPPLAFVRQGRTTGSVTLSVPDRRSLGLPSVVLTVVCPPPNKKNPRISRSGFRVSPR